MVDPIRVLHLDDDETFAELTATFLERESDRFEVVTETRTADALDRLGDGNGIDCIVSDYALPGMDGLEFLAAVREEHPDLPFVFFTGKGNEAVASEALAGGATEYLQKGSGTEQYGLLANRVHNAVEAYRDRRELERSERYRRELYRITSDTAASVEEKVGRLLELGCERLGVENGHVVRIDPDSGRHETTNAEGSALVQPGVVTDLEETYCRKTIDVEDILAVYNAPAEGWADDPAYERWDIGCYIGGRIEVDEELYGTLCFVNGEPRERAFTEAERGFVDLATRWLSHIFERRARERDLAEFREVVNAVPDGICVLDAEFAFTMVNDAMTDLTGYDREELLGADATQVFDEGTIDAGRRNIEELRDGDREFEYLDAEVRTAGGGTVPCEIRGTAFPGVGGEKSYGTAVVVRDMSDREGR
ncbi:MAG: response regulator [Halobacteriales archaeon]